MPEFDPHELQQDKKKLTTGEFIEAINGRPGTRSDLKITRGEHIQLESGVFNHLGAIYPDNLYIIFDSYNISSPDNNSSIDLVPVGRDQSLLTLVFIGCIIPKIKILDSKINLINCQVQAIEWPDGSRGELYMKCGTVKHLMMKKTKLLKDSVLSLIDVAIHFIQLEELLVNGQLIFRNITPVKHQAKDEFPKHALLRIVNSSLGTTEITGGDLWNFDFEYRNSKLMDCFICGVRLPESIYQPEQKEEIEVQTMQIGEIEPKTNSKGTWKEKRASKREAKRAAQKERKKVVHQKIAFYNQLFKVFDGMGDNIESSWQQSRAWQYQQELLAIEYSSKDGLKKNISQDAFDWLELWLNKVSNKNGESWIRALFFIVIASLIMYCLYYTTLIATKVLPSPDLGHFTADYLDFLDITHKSDFLISKYQVIQPNVILTIVAKIIDFLGKVFIGYGIYQFFAAFRRHGRKA